MLIFSVKIRNWNRKCTRFISTILKFHDKKITNSQKQTINLEDFQKQVKTFSNFHPTKLKRMIVDKKICSRIIFHQKQIKIVLITCSDEIFACNRTKNKIIKIQNIKIHQGNIVMKFLKKKIPFSGDRRYFRSHLVFQKSLRTQTHLNTNLI